MSNCDNRVQQPLKRVTTINDEALSEDTDPSYELQYIDIGNVDSSGRIHEIADYRFENAPSRARRIVRHGDVIISTVRTYLQAITSIEAPPDNFIVSTGFAVVRPQPAALDTAYCKYALREPSFIHEVVNRSVGVSYPAINASELGDIPIYIPPLSEQRAIADYLDRETAKIDILIAAKQRLLDLLVEKRRVLVSKAVTQGLKPTDFCNVNIPWLNVVPAHWTTQYGRYLFEQSSLSVRENDEIVTCFRDGQVTLRRNRREEGFTNAILEVGYQGIRKGQLVVHSMDAFAGAIGVSDSDGKCTPEYIICDPINELAFTPYFGYLLREMALQGFIQASCPAVRERAPRIRFSDIKDMIFPVPPIEEQKEIVSHILTSTSTIDHLQNVAMTTIALLHERRTALIATAVTGKLRLKG